MPNYELVEADDKFWAIQLTEGKYAGVVFRYGTIKFVGEDEEGFGHIQFEFDVITTPEDIKREDVTGEEFDKIAGEILQGIIRDSVEDYAKNTSEEEFDGNDTKDNTKESDTQ